MARSRAAGSGRPSRPGHKPRKFDALRLAPHHDEQPRGRPLAHPFRRQAYASPVSCCWTLLLTCQQGELRPTLASGREHGARRLFLHRALPVRTSFGRRRLLAYVDDSGKARVRRGLQPQEASHEHWHCRCVTIHSHTTRVLTSSQATSITARRR